MDLPLNPPTSSPKTGIPLFVNSSRQAMTFRVPTGKGLYWMELNMFAPPHQFRFQPTLVDTLLDQFS